MSTSLKPAEYLRKAREIEANWPAQMVSVATISSFTAELLRPYLIVEADALNCPARPWFGAFGQLEQLVLDENSPLWQQNPDVLWIAVRIEDVDRYLPFEAAGLGPDATRDRLAEIRHRVIDLAKAARARHRASILVSNFAIGPAQAAGLFDASDPDGYVHLLAESNRELARELAQVADAHVFDYAGAVSQAGAELWSDPKLWYMARSACSSQNLAALGRRLARAVCAMVRPAAKCLVLDLDNTLWGGVLGDDRPHALKLGDDYPGSVFKDFQAALLGLRARGFLLAVASKNDRQTVLDMLDTHPEMLIKREHLAAIYANWDGKPGNLRAIASDLNIGLDSLVFIDDNPVERAAVRAELPMVQVLELPADPLGYLQALADMAGLDRPRLLDEDRHRAQMVERDAMRQVERQQTGNIADFLASLKMTAQVGLCDAATIERICQLIQKTNQFNLTTRRHKLEDVRRMADSPDHAVAWLRLADRYGDLGLVCVGILARADESTWDIDTLLMSCRVMGRQVEDAFLAFLAEIASDRGARRLRGLFLPTPKNKPVERFYGEHGFSELPGDKGQFEIDLLAGTLAWPAVIARLPQTTRKHAIV
ncbi:MAG TPA: HAD-IIIC family phosphatase [Pirellulales bacterium]|jgi:FkbH-like protein